MAAPRALRAIRMVHTVVGAFFATIVLAIPVAVWQGRFALWLGLVAIVLVEVTVLAMYGWRCPLTGVAARYAEDRRDNFDIYLPLLVARYNKQIFGALYLGGIAAGFVRWLG